MCCLTWCSLQLRSACSFEAELIRQADAEGSARSFIGRRFVADTTSNVERANAAWTSSVGDVNAAPPTGAPYAGTVVASNSSASGWGASQKNGIDPGRTIRRTLTQDESGSNPHGADVRKRAVPVNVRSWPQGEEAGNAALVR